MNRASEIDLKRFAAEVRTKRGKQGLRATAVEIGDISAPTLSRIEQGNVPDLDSFIRICKWLGRSPQSFTGEQSATAKESTPKQIEAYLRADKILSEETVKAISTMVVLAYDAVKKDKM